MNTRQPHYWKRACADLSARDPVLASLIARYPDAVLADRGDPFQTLARAIVGQQISVKAADSVWTRLLAVLPAVTASELLMREPASLRACGLSARKVEYVVDLARHFDERQIHDDHWSAMSDAEIISELTAVRGIGVWSAEMFLIFNQLRPDVFPLDDIGLQKAVARHYCRGERPGRRLLVEHGKRWRHWRSVATWYLWRSLDPVPVEY